jgi:phosphohistidine phosphatase
MPTTRELYVLRHAKSSWEDAGLDDHERPLAPRGQRATKLLAAHLRSQGIEPVQVLCSSARRTRETLEGVDPGGEVLIERELYDASASDILARLQRVPGETPSVMVVGHNPALQILVLRLAGATGSRRTGDAGKATGDLSEVRRKFPTGALATLRFDCAWNELGAGTATLAALVRPKQLH